MGTCGRKIRRRQNPVGLLRVLTPGKRVTETYGVFQPYGFFQLYQTGQVSLYLLVQVAGWAGTVKPECNASAGDNHKPRFYRQQEQAEA